MVICNCGQQASNAGVAARAPLRLSRTLALDLRGLRFKLRERIRLAAISRSGHENFRELILAAISRCSRAFRGVADWPGVDYVASVPDEVVRELVATGFGHRDVLPRTSDRNLSTRPCTLLLAEFVGFSPLGLPQERLGRFRKVTVAVSDAHAQFDVAGPSF